MLPSPKWGSALRQPSRLWVLPRSLCYLLLKSFLQKQAEETKMYAKSILQIPSSDSIAPPAPANWPPRQTAAHPGYAAAAKIRGRCS